MHKINDYGHGGKDTFQAQYLILLIELIQLSEGAQGYYYIYISGLIF